MIKRYSSKCARISINVKREGRTEMITFNQYNHDNKTRYIDIKEAEIQKQFEASQDFNVYFHLEKTWDDPEEVKLSPKETVIELPKPELEEKPALEFDDLKSAKKYLEKNNIPIYQTANKERTIEVFNRHGINVIIK